MARPIAICARAPPARVFGQVLAREYSDRSLLPIHRFSVDAYAVQHPGGTGRQSIQSVGLHLSRLYLTIDRDLTLDKVNRIAILLSARKKTFAWLTPPASRGELTVSHVAEADSTLVHSERVRNWARSAFGAWSDHHAQVAAWTRDLAN